MNKPEQQEQFKLSDQGVMAIMLVLQKAMQFAEGGMKGPPEEVHIPTMLQNLQWSNSPQGLIALNPPVIQIEEREAFEELDLTDLAEDILEK